jgi:hypothetical protein
LPRRTSIRLRNRRLEPPDPVAPRASSALDDPKAIAQARALAAARTADPEPEPAPYLDPDRPWLP